MYETVASRIDLWLAPSRAVVVRVTPLFFLAACATAPEARPPEVVAPPTPSSVTRENPGGDASDPFAAALERLAKAPSAAKRDQWKTLSGPLPDGKTWRRVLVGGYPTRATYRYGDEGYAWAAVYYTRAKGSDAPQDCLEAYLDETTSLGDSYGASVRLGERSVVKGKLGEVIVQQGTAEVSSLFLDEDYVGGVAAYPSFPGTCLIQAFAVKASDHVEQATSARDRWTANVAKNLTWSKQVKEAPPLESR